MDFRSASQIARALALEGCKAKVVRDGGIFAVVMNGGRVAQRKAREMLAEVRLRAAEAAAEDGPQPE